MELEQPVPEPSPVAIWLMTLFGAGEQGQAVLGDLLEEFSYRRLNMSSPATRRWFWRQTLWTILYLVGRVFRSAPVTIIAAAIGGFSLRWYVSRSYRPMLMTAIDTLVQRFHPYELDYHAYSFWTIHIVYTERFLMNFFIGVILGAALKGRELAGAIALVALGDVLAIQSMLMATSHTGDRGYLWTLPWTFAFSLAVIVGGATVRMRRMKQDIACKTQV